MNLKRVYDIYNAIKDRLPFTYPRPKLAFFEDEDSMLDNNQMEKDDGLSCYAIVNPETLTINLPLSMTFEWIGVKGNTYTNTIPITKQSDENIANTILHEIGHLYAGERYGFDSNKYSDEGYCDRFATRWVRVLLKENLLS